MKPSLIVHKRILKFLNILKLLQPFRTFLISPTHRKWISVPWLHIRNLINFVNDIPIDIEPNGKYFVSKSITKLKNKIVFRLIQQGA